MRLHSYEAGNTNRLPEGEKPRGVSAGIILSHPLFSSRGHSDEMARFAGVSATGSSHPSHPIFDKGGDPMNWRGSVIANTSGRG